MGREAGLLPAFPSPASHSTHDRITLHPCRCTPVVTLVVSIARCSSHPVKMSIHDSSVQLGGGASHVSTAALVFRCSRLPPSTHEGPAMLLFHRAYQAGLRKDSPAYTALAPSSSSMRSSCRAGRQAGPTTHQPTRTDWQNTNRHLPCVMPVSVLLLLYLVVLGEALGPGRGARLDLARAQAHL